jgi:hypothetical protein
MRKTLITFSIIVCSGFEIFAHGPQEGCLALMGSFGFMLSKQPEQYAKKTISIAPSLNYFVRDKFSLGLRVVLKTTLIHRIKQGSTNGIEVFGRYYFTRNVMGAKASFFIEANTGINIEKTIPGNNVDGVSTFSVGALPGFAIFPNDKIGFEFSLPNVIGFYSSSFQGENAGSKFEFGPSTIAGPQITMFVFID